MTPADVLRDHDATAPVAWRVRGRDVVLATKVGVRGAPGLDPAFGALAEAIARDRADLGGGPLLDATGGQGPVAALARSEGVPARVLVASAAARRAAIASGTDEDDIVSGFPWDLAPAAMHEVWWRPPGDRGNARIEAELRAWARALAPDGVVWAVWHRDEGGKHAERLAGASFGALEVVKRASGWRVVALRDPLPDAPEPASWRDWDGPDGAMRSLVGTHAAARLDPGTAVLLDALDAASAPELEGSRVLDLGCGTGVLARRGRERGAREVIATDDDLAAVRSTRFVLGLDQEGAPGGAVYRPVAAGHAPARVEWSDLLGQERDAAGVDLVLMNPPFHVGRQVVGALSRAFVAAALEALRPGGRLLMVANRALPYERDLAAWATWRDVTPAGAKGFKVLDATTR